MSAHLALEAHLRDHPHDEQSWRVYADWLTDQGAPRGPLVQRLIQGPDDIELAGLASEGLDWEPTARQARVVRRYSFVWKAVLRGDRAGRTLQEMLQRCDTQFLTSITFDTLQAREAPLLLELLPQTHARELVFYRPGLPMEALSELWTSVPAQELGVYNARLSPRLLRWPRGLKRLMLAHCLDLDALEALVNAQELACVTSLDLSGNPLGEDGAAILAKAPLTEGLSVLDLSDNAIEDEGLITLIEAGRLRGLVELDLSSNELSDEGIQALVESDLSGLRSLNLSHNPFGDEGAELLAACPALRDLDQLDLGSCGLSLQGAELIRRELRCRQSGA